MMKNGDLGFVKPKTHGTYLGKEDIKGMSIEDMFIPFIHNKENKNILDFGELGDGIELKITSNLKKQ
jgi:hypothetical protein